jgi:outer membrane protein assembly factor BamB
MPFARPMLTASTRTRSASEEAARPRLRFGLVSCLPLAFLACTLSSAWAETPDASPADAWPVARGTASGCGVAGGSLPDAPALLWTFTVENQGFQAGAVIEGGNVYIGSTNGTLYCIDLADGKKRWDHAGKSIFKTTPAVRDGRVFIGDQDGEFDCFDARSGKRLWTFSTDGPIDSPANFYRDCVLFGSEDAGEYCLRAADGKLVWKFDMEDQVRCPATIAGNRGYFATCGATLYAIDLDKGTAVSKVKIDSPTGCAAALAKDRAFVGNEENVFLGIDLVKGAIAWRYQDPVRPMSFRSSAAVTAEGVYVGSRDKKLHAFDPQTGRQLWEFTTRGMVDSSPVVVGGAPGTPGRVFFGSLDGRIYGLDRQLGKEVWHYDAGGKISASPAVAAGRLVIGSESGHLYCFGK